MTFTIQLIETGMKACVQGAADAKAGKPYTPPAGACEYTCRMYRDGYHGPTLKEPK